MAGVAGLNSLNKINRCDAETASKDPAETAANPGKCRTIWTDGYTYFIRGSEGIKIGQSLNPVARRRELQPGSATRLKLLLAVPYSWIPEPEAHKKFKHLRMEGEWFRPDQELLDFIGELEAKLNPHSGPRIHKGSTEVEKTVTGLLKQRRGASQVKKNLIHNMIQQLRNYSAEEDPVAKANLERMIAYTAGKLEQAA